MKAPELIGWLLAGACRETMLDGREVLGVPIGGEGTLICGALAVEGRDTGLFRPLTGGPGRNLGLFGPGVGRGFEGLLARHVRGTTPC